MSNALCELEDTFDMEHNLVDTPLEGCRDIFMHEGSPSLACENVIHLSIPMFQPFVHNLHFSLGILMVRPLIILRFVILTLKWAMRIACLISLVGMLKSLSP